MTSASAADAVEPGVYEHYKGGRYEVFFVARHTETEEEFVVYRQLYGDHRHWVRTLTMFLDTVERDGRTVRRFTRIE